MTPTPTTAPKSHVYAQPQLVGWAQTTDVASVAVVGSGTLGRPVAVAALGVGLGGWCFSRRTSSRLSGRA